MNKSPLNSKGFGLVGTLIVVVVIGALAGGGAYVWHKNHNKKPSTKTSQTNSTSTTTTSKPPTTTDPTANWVKVTSIGGAYSMKVPDGWKLTNYPGNVLNGDDITFSAGTPATAATASSPYAGDQRKFNVGFTNDRSAEGTAPQWQSPNPYGTESVEDFSIGSIKGKRYSIEYTQTVTGVTKGDKIYQYTFDLPNNKGLGVVYMQSAGDPDNLATVEQAIKTIVIN